jgi:hypothetical protein
MGGYSFPTKQTHSDRGNTTTRHVAPKTQTSVPQIQVHKPPLTQPHRTPDQSYDLINKQKTDHSTGDKQQEAPEEERAVDQSMDTSDTPREMCPRLERMA